MRQRGFTLIELIAMIILLSVLAVTILPRISLLQGFDSIAFGDQLRSTLQFARKSAIAQRRFVCVGINSNKLTVTRNLPPPESVTGSITCTTPLSLPGSSSNTLSVPNSVTLAPDNTRIVFDSLGRATGQLSFIVQESTSATALTVTVESETGYVH